MFTLAGTKLLISTEPQSLYGKQPFCCTSHTKHKDSMNLIFQHEETKIPGQKMAGEGLYYQFIILPVSDLIGTDSSYYSSDTMIT